MEKMKYFGTLLGLICLFLFGAWLAAPAPRVLAQQVTAFTGLIDLSIRPQRVLTTPTLIVHGECDSGPHPYPYGHQHGDGHGIEHSDGYSDDDRHPHAGLSGAGVAWSQRGGRGQWRAGGDCRGSPRRRVDGGE
jgi:hypothetical protein